MFLMNLTFLQLLAVFGSASALIVALYLLDRNRRRQIVPTLRFWIAAANPSQTARRRRIHQPWSLLLQLLALALLLLAVGQLRFGSRGPAARDHVLLLDTGAWMAAQSGANTLMEEARELALDYVRALPAADRAMVVRTDALATPVTAFESNRSVLERAIRESRPGATALNLEQALAFAQQALKLQGGEPGDIIYIGSGRITRLAADSELLLPSNFRALPVPDSVENAGLRKIGLRRSTNDASVWDVFVSVHNYGKKQKTVRLRLDFGGAPAGTRSLVVPAGSEQETTFDLRTGAAGRLEIRLISEDAFPGDDQAVLDLPALRLLKVAVYSDDPDPLRPLLMANPWASPEFKTTSEYDSAAAADIVILDRFHPGTGPRSHSIWIEPPVESSPIPVRASLEHVKLTGWRPDHALAAGIRTRELELERADVYLPSRGDIEVAMTASGPTILGRELERRRKMVLLGFNPGRSEMRYELAAPLLFANILRWMEPEMFRRWELNAGSAGTVSVDLGSQAPSENLKVLGEDGSEIPFTAQDGRVRLFMASPGIVRVISDNRELVYSLTLPEVAEAQWQPPPETVRDIPGLSIARDSFSELWPWLALAGALLLLLEWLLYGRGRSAPSNLPRTPELPQVRVSRQAGNKEPPLRRYAGGAGR